MQFLSPKASLIRRLKSTNSEVIGKIDIKKAYHHVNWDFLILVLIKMGFCHKWVS